MRKCIYPIIYYNAKSTIFLIILYIYIYMKRNQKLRRQNRTPPDHMGTSCPKVHWHKWMPTHEIYHINWHKCTRFFTCTYQFKLIISKEKKKIQPRNKSIIGHFISRLTKHYNFVVYLGPRAFNVTYYTWSW